MELFLTILKVIGIGYLSLLGSGLLMLFGIDVYRAIKKRFAPPPARPDLSERVQRDILKILENADL